MLEPIAAQDPSHCSTPGRISLIWRPESLELSEMTPDGLRLREQL